MVGGACIATQHLTESSALAHILHLSWIIAAGVQQLPAATPYALEALGAPSHALRRLGCQQLGAALPVGL